MQRVRRISSAIVDGFAPHRGHKTKPPGAWPGGLLSPVTRCLPARTASAGIPMWIRVERRFRDPAADDRNEAVRGHHEHFARPQFALLVVADEQAADDRA